MSEHPLHWWKTKDWVWIPKGHILTFLIIFPQQHKAVKCLNFLYLRIFNLPFQFLFKPPHTGLVLHQECPTGEAMLWPVRCTCCIPARPISVTCAKDWDWNLEPPQHSSRTGLLTCHLWTRRSPSFPLWCVSGYEAAKPVTWPWRWTDWPFTPHTLTSSPECWRPR